MRDGGAPNEERKSWAGLVPSSQEALGRAPSTLSRLVLPHCPGQLLALPALSTSARQCHLPSVLATPILSSAQGDLQPLVELSPLHTPLRPAPRGPPCPARPAAPICPTVSKHQLPTGSIPAASFLSSEQRTHVTLALQLSTVSGEWGAGGTERGTLTLPPVIMPIL